MATPVEFFFDYSSPYSYIASQAIEQMATRHGRAVDWRPFMLGAVFKVSGGAPLTQLYEPKARYSMRDFERSARFAGLQYRHPDPFPISTVNTARATLWVKAHAPERTGEFVRTAGRSFFAANRPINDPGVLREIASAVGVDADALEAGIGEQPIKDALKATSDEAIARGVFGAPFVFIDGEAFWGNDRMPQIEQWLERGGF